MWANYNYSLSLPSLSALGLDLGLHMLHVTPPACTAPTRVGNPLLSLLAHQLSAREAQLIFTHCWDISAACGSAQVLRVLADAQVAWLLLAGPDSKAVC